MEGTCCCGAGKRRDAENWEVEEGIAQRLYGTELLATRRWIARNRVHYCVYLTRILVYQPFLPTTLPTFVHSNLPWNQGEF